MKVPMAFLSQVWQYPWLLFFLKTRVGSFLVELGCYLCSCAELKFYRSDKENTAINSFFVACSQCPMFFQTYEDIFVCKDPRNLSSRMAKR